jgi:hypothetical protein
MTFAGAIFWPPSGRTNERVTASGRSMVKNGEGANLPILLCRVASGLTSFELAGGIWEGTEQISRRTDQRCLAGALRIAASRAAASSACV